MLRRRGGVGAVNRQIGDSGLSRCFGASGTGASHFVSVQRPVTHAFNQHARTVDKQRIRTRAILYRWSGTAWQAAYTPAGVLIQTPWRSEVVSDGSDSTMQLPGYTTHLGTLTVPRNGYYAVLFDIRWDATNTVTVSGSKTLWSTLFEENGEFWLGPHSYCDYYPRVVEIPL